MSCVIRVVNEMTLILFIFLGLVHFKVAHDVH